MNRTHGETRAAGRRSFGLWRRISRPIPILAGTLQILAFTAIPFEQAVAAKESKGLLVTQAPIEISAANFGRLKKHALIIGINAYENRAQGIPSLRYAVRDAKAMYAALTDSRRGGFSPDNVQLLCDDGPIHPTSSNIGRALTRLAARAGETDLVFVFFSGHGLEEEGRAYLLPSNADLDALDYTALERDAFIRQIDKLRAKKVVVVLDACHSGGVSRGGKAAGREALLTPKYYDQFASARGRAFIASCSGGELSWEDEESRQGVFTGALVKGISGAADRAPADGVVSLFELRGYIEEEVEEWARKKGKSQHPQVNLESTFGDIPLALNRQFLDLATRALQAMEAEARSLRSQVVEIPELAPEEVAHALTLSDKLGKGAPLTRDDDRELEFLRKLVVGAIDTKMYRAGVSRPNLPVAVQESAPAPEGRWSVSLLSGLAQVSSDSLLHGTSFSPGALVACRLADGLAVEVEYTHYIARVVRRNTPVHERSANAISIALSAERAVAGKVRAQAGLGVGDYFGDDVRDTGSRKAVRLFAGAALPFGSRALLRIRLAGMFSNAQLMDPAASALRQALAVQVGLGWSN